MSSNASIAQEYYKVVDLWEEASQRKAWQLAIWVLEFNDVDIVDRFLEIERSVLGHSDDIFFRFDTEFQGGNESFVQGLWNEYLSWFTEETNPDYDILGALKKDDMLFFEYTPDNTLPKTVANLWKEFLRLKSSIKELDNDHFCIYLPPTRPDGDNMTDFFQYLLDEGIPHGLRITTIDYAKSRKIKVESSKKVLLLKPKLNMQEALRNALEKEDNTNLLAPENRYKIQVGVVMDCTTGKDKKRMIREVNKLISISEEITDFSIRISASFIAAEAFYAMGEYDRSMEYTEQTIEQSKKAMDQEIPTGFDYWKLAMFMKAAILSSRKKRDKAIAIYEEVAGLSMKRKDPFYVMEAYRQSGYLYYELGSMEKAFEHFLLSLTGGSYLSMDIRRTSTFLYSAHLALLTAQKVRSPNDIAVLEEQLEEWLGSDWKELVLNNDMSKAKARRRASLFS